jgi:beta-mannosidase
MGICVWHDFIFACAAYPSFDKEWLKNVEIEAGQNIQGLRHHPCIAIWCGNNELEQGLVGEKWTGSQMGAGDYERLFDRLLPDIVKKHDPERDYWPSSPHSPRGNRYAECSDFRWGDAHLWGVWHGGDKFPDYRKWHPRFASEFGFQSFPEPRTVRSFAEQDDRNVTTFVMEHHQRSGIGNAKIMHHMLDWFRLPTSFDMTLWLSQILQGVGITIAIEHWRRVMPRCMGALYWQINDCWPVASWSSIDSFGRWKALHYMAKRFYAPVLLTATADEKRGKVQLWLTNDMRKSQRGMTRWQLTDLTGRRLVGGRLGATVGAQRSKRVGSLDLKRHLDTHGKRNVVLWLEFGARAKTLSENQVLFAQPKHMELPDPAIHVHVNKGSEDCLTVTLKSSKVALWAWLESEAVDARFSDNFFHLRPECPVSVSAKPSKHMSPSDFGRQLVVRSLVDTYR